MSTEQDDKITASTLRYTRGRLSTWTRFQLAVLTVFGLSYLFLGTSTLELLYCIPGERSLFGQDTDLGYLGAVAAISAPVLLLVSIAIGRIELVVAAIGNLALAIVWMVRFFVLMSYL